MSSPEEPPKTSYNSDISSEDVHSHTESPDSSPYFSTLLRQHCWYSESVPHSPPPLTPLSVSDSHLDHSPDELRDISYVTRRRRQPKVSKKEFVRKKLGELYEAKISLPDILSYIIDSANGTFEGYRNAFLTSKHLFPFLNQLFADEKGRRLIQEWMFPHAVELVSEKIHTEMEEAKPELKMGTADVTPEFIAQWDINGLMNSVAEKTPTWSRILEAATEEKSAQLKPKTAKSRNRLTVLVSITIYKTN